MPALAVDRRSGANVEFQGCDRQVIPNCEGKRGVASPDLGHAGVAQNADAACAHGSEEWAQPVEQPLAEDEVSPGSTAETWQHKPEDWIPLIEVQTPLR